VAAVAEARFVLPFDIRKVFAGENRIGHAALNLATLEVSHACKRFVCKDHSKLVIQDDYTFIKLFEESSPSREANLEFRWWY
jgi:hypothetical protein